MGLIRLIYGAKQLGMRVDYGASMVEGISIGRVVLKSQPPVLEAEDGATFPNRPGHQILASELYETA